MRSEGIAAASTSGGSRRPRRAGKWSSDLSEFEGLSFIRTESGKRFLLKDAVETAGDALLGSEVMRREGGWNILCKFFDNMGPIPHHMHQSDEFAAKVGHKGKPEAYYFPPQYNQIENNFPYTFMGLEPGTTKEHVRRCLENWNKGDNGILNHSRAYRLEVGPDGRSIPAFCTRPARWSRTNLRSRAASSRCFNRWSKAALLTGA